MLWFGLLVVAVSAVVARARFAAIQFVSGVSHACYVWGEG